MRKLLTIFMTSVLLASLPAICQAQAATAVAPSPEKVALVKRYFAAIHFDEMMSGMVNQMTPAMMAQMRQNQPNMTDAFIRGTLL